MPGNKGKILLQNNELVDNVLRYVPWHNIVKLSHASRTSQTAVRLWIKRRLEKMLGEYLSTMGQVAFWRILKMTGGALVGATGWILLNPDTNYHKDDLPANLNVIIPVGKDDVWDNVMVLLGYQLAEIRPIAVGMEDRASKCLVYKKGCIVVDRSNDHGDTV
ncbi:hypothetical protein H0H93_011475 [Arthromyces matolae]|nr:hypothetical protein H0H93_011475 [Arthromyces matolae]